MGVLPPQSLFIWTKCPAVFQEEESREKGGVRLSQPGSPVHHFYSCPFALSGHMTPTFWKREEVGRMLGEHEREDLA